MTKPNRKFTSRSYNNNANLQQRTYGTVHTPGTPNVIYGIYTSPSRAVASSFLGGAPRGSNAPVLCFY